MRRFRIGIYRHFKGGLYGAVNIAEHSETREKFVVYFKMGESGWFVRPLEMFMSEVDHEKYPDAKQKYRFEWHGMKWTPEME